MHSPASFHNCGVYKREAFRINFHLGTDLLLLEKQFWIFAVVSGLSCVSFIHSLRCQNLTRPLLLYSVVEILFLQTKMQLLKFVTLLGLTGTALAVPNAFPEPQRGRQCTTYSTMTQTITIAPTVTVPVAIVAIKRTVNCGSCVLEVRTRVIRKTAQRVRNGRAVKTVVRRSTATTYQPVCRTPVPARGQRNNGEDEDDD
ncbi:hypothetical protein EYR41_006382 [Orbilia oligospora]|uniref:Uncharacterized protein n=1 Tax=Orbilia oligospora TaxID=2813651 RepID=A0A7C8PJC7_ORBOL|nr:hypothetical protein TWF751_007666 [Orbilia oligospora]TGJ70418.1 hypothetical protein EYR41_006382 [Orbilia oligospora]